MSPDLPVLRAKVWPARIIIIIIANDGNFYYKVSKKIIINISLFSQRLLYSRRTPLYNYFLFAMIQYSNSVTYIPRVC